MTAVHPVRLADKGEVVTFGDPARFAVALVLDDDEDGHWLYGRFCFWIGGQRVGNWDLSALLGDALTVVTQVARSRGRRENCDLFRLPAEVAFRRLNETIYGRNGMELPEAEQVEDGGWLEIVPVWQVFNNCKGFLVECRGQARLLHRGEQPGVREVALRGGEADVVLRQAHAYLTVLVEEHEARSGPPG